MSKTDIKETILKEFDEKNKDLLSFLEAHYEAMKYFKARDFLSEAIDLIREEERERILKKMKPALDDFTSMGKQLIKSGMFEKSGNEVIENIGYIKSLFINSNSLTEKQNI